MTTSDATRVRVGPCDVTAPTFYDVIFAGVTQRHQTYVKTLETSGVRVRVYGVLLRHVHTKAVGGVTRTRRTL